MTTCTLSIAKNMVKMTENLQKTLLIINFAPLKARWRTFFPAGLSNRGRPDGGIGRHEGLKIPWLLQLCGFKSRSGYYLHELIVD